MKFSKKIFNIEKISQILLDFIGDENFVEPALVDLFNADYRKLANSLLDISEHQPISNSLKTDNEEYEFGIRELF